MSTDYTFLTAAARPVAKPASFRRKALMKSPTNQADYAFSLDLNNWRGSLASKAVKTNFGMNEFLPVLDKVFRLDIAGGFLLEGELKHKAGNEKEALESYRKALDNCNSALNALGPYNTDNQDIAHAQEKLAKKINDRIAGMSQAK